MVSRILPVAMLFTDKFVVLTPFSFIHRFARFTADCLLLPSGIAAPRSL